MKHEQSAQQTDVLLTCEFRNPERLFGSQSKDVLGPQIDTGGQGRPNSVSPPGGRVMWRDEETEPLASSLHLSLSAAVEHSRDTDTLLNTLKISEEARIEDCLLYTSDAADE